VGEWRDSDQCVRVTDRTEKTQDGRSVSKREIVIRSAGRIISIVGGESIGKREIRPIRRRQRIEMMVVGKDLKEKFPSCIDVVRIVGCQCHFGIEKKTFWIRRRCEWKRRPWSFACCECFQVIF
jgi:hypothetical protein